MKKSLILHKYIVYLYVISLFFETCDFFNLGIDFLTTKISVVLLLLSSCINFQIFLNLKFLFKPVKWLFFFFLYALVISFHNRSGLNINILNIPFLLNIFILVVLLCSEFYISGLLMNSLLLAAFVNFCLLFFYFFDIDVTYLDDRVTILGINQNYLGLISCVSFFVVLLSSRFKKKSHINRNLVNLFILIFLLFLIIKTGSRVAFISLVIGIFVAMFSSFNIAKLIIRSLVIMPILGISYFLFLDKSLIIQRIFDTVKDGDLSNRDWIWVQLFDVVKNHYLFGIGWTGYKELIGNDSPHNVLLEVLAYSGVFGLICFLLFLVDLIKSAKSRIVNEKLRSIKLLVLIVLIGLLLSGQWFDQKIVWIYIAFIFSYNGFYLKLNKRYSDAGIKEEVNNLY